MKKSNTKKNKNKIKFTQASLIIPIYCCKICTNSNLVKKNFQKIKQKLQKQSKQLLNPGLSKHQEVGFTPMTKVPTFIAVDPDR